MSIAFRHKKICNITNKNQDTQEKTAKVVVYLRLAILFVRLGVALGRGSMPGTSRVMVALTMRTSVSGRSLASRSTACIFYTTYMHYVTSPNTV